MILCRVFLTIFLSSLLLVSSSSEKDFTKFVDPFIGTGAHGHTYPGASMPFGMVQLSPDSGRGNWDRCSGYHYTDRTITGFSHTHLSGTGIGDYGDILFMPLKSSIDFRSEDSLKKKHRYPSAFNKENEKAAPGYYSVELESRIKAELTTTLRAGFHRYTYKNGEKPAVIVDLDYGINWDKTVETEINIKGSKSISGYRKSSGWAKKQLVCFHTEFSSPIKDYLIISEGKVLSKKLSSFKGKDIKIVLFFNKTDKILAKTGISAVNQKGAATNLKREIPHWNFDQIRDDAQKAWNRVLSKIEVKTNDLSRKRVFYTALYHSFLCPNLFMDVDGNYRGIDRKIHKADGFTNYTLFSLWDTFRATKPLFNILCPDRSTDFVNSLLMRYKEGGRLPKWELAGNYTGTMIGYHAIPVIVDAHIKGIGGFDTALAYEAVRESAFSDREGMKHYRKYGYIPWELENESVSKTLEYSYNDWCIGQMAEKLGKKEDAALFAKRALYFKNLFDPSTGFMRGKNAKGEWKSPFDPLFASHRKDEYTEGNAWQYTWFVPHHPNKLIDLMGGEEKFLKKLNQLFSIKEKVKGEHSSPDISGLIGQYAHGNEPSHHIPYLFNYAGSPERAEEIVSQIVNDLYSDKPDGLCGNEDCGQMSSWYIFSAMGFYPDCPGKPVYQTGRPFFDEVQINLPNKKSFVIKAENLQIPGARVKEILLNGRVIKNRQITHKDLMKGGELIFKMGSGIK